MGEASQLSGKRYMQHVLNLFLYNRYLFPYPGALKVPLYFCIIIHLKVKHYESNRIQTIVTHHRASEFY
jgi:hypothetical protein